MSMERRLLMTAFGGELVLTPGKEGMSGCIAKAEELKQQNPGSIIAGQFVNPANPDAHYRTTGPEIWEDTDGNVDIFVATIGTGGTITGTGTYLKEKNPAIQVIGVEPEESPLISKGYAAPHGIQGIGANFIPEILNTGLLDQVMTVNVQQAYEAGRRMGKEEGILVGISSGAALYAALELAKKEENTGKTIVAVLPDSGERYLTTAMYQS
jgi:cysteine synthase A